MSRKSGERKDQAYEIRKILIIVKVLLELEIHFFKTQIERMIIIGV